MDYIKKPVCPGCGSIEYEGFTCAYCKEENKKYKEIFQFAKGYNNIDEYYNENILEPILKQECLTKENDEIFKMLLENYMIKAEALPDEAVFRTILKGKKVVSYDTFEEVLKRYIENIMLFLKKIDKNMVNFNPVCFITTLKDCSGSTIEDICVAVDKDMCKKFYDNSDIWLFITAHHELRHVIQNIGIKCGIFLESQINILKEKIIKDYETKKYGTKDYYTNNYSNISFEVDARKFGVSGAIDLLKRLGFSLNGDYLKLLNEQYIMDTDSIERKIIINGKEEYKTLDEIFDEIIKLEPQYLDLYPQLQVEYIKEDNSVRRKTKDELVETLLKNIENNEITNYIKGLLEINKSNFNL